jgi:hypothetical protein
MNGVGQAVEVGDHPVGECRHRTRVRFDLREGQGDMAGPLALGEVEVGPDGLSGIVDGEGILGPRSGLQGDPRRPEALVPSRATVRVPCDDCAMLLACPLKRLATHRPSVS